MMQITHTPTYQFRDHLRQVEELLAPIRNDGSLSDAERRQMISDVVAAANARALSLHAARFEASRFHRELASVG